MKKDIINLISQLVKINSVYPNEKKTADFVLDYFNKRGYKPVRQKIEKNRDNIIVEKGAGKRTVILYSHLDTVDVTGGWKSNPFELKIEGDRASGLGAWDMKSGATINILNFINYEPKNFKLKIIFCVDEENISKGASKFIRSSHGKNIDCVISTEPAFKHGLQGIATGRIGRAVYRVEVKGESKHTAFYETRYDTNFFAAELLLSINKSLNKIRGDKKQYFFANRIESSAVGMSLPEKTLIILESSIIPPVTHDQMLSKLKRMINAKLKKYNNYYKVEVGFVKRETPFLNGYEIEKGNKYLRFLAKSVKTVTNESAIPYFRSSVADENIFGSHGNTVLSIGPIGANAHAPNEWVSLKSLEKLYNILIKFLEAVDSQLVTSH
ncbi:MAG: ArgE/DapE-related deacylase [Candidatus Roizmanbacteria bacterium GW2011_GWA2_35_19]|uniref:ArgE/DapE-related deacylase n=2 Tax=Candidatus Roizmaniibacteriota TaxID=1752723 RepID=A0A0G0BYN4_9BACT|nr:MAG: ArgE/DapE-related deacylase [Candidatus Roizmanbacteria bacterium GW2011_GWC2_35_12]KKP74434.1 MAG: ArgE/DapE-related deacylase [Candidatus Roizmanbacteria bacterium GW2011_GWA2_35_19]